MKPIIFISSIVGTEINGEFFRPAHGSEFKWCVRDNQKQVFVTQFGAVEVEINMRILEEPKKAV